MKKITRIAFVAIAMLCNKQNVYAQITLEHTYSTASCHLYMVNLELEGHKYIWRDLWVGQRIVLYNLDHSVFRIMPLPALSWASNTIPSVLYISEHLFDTDDGVEYMFSYTNQITNRWITKIINEDASIVFEADSLVPLVMPNMPQQQLPIYNTANGTKMILSYGYGGAIANVYSLPGNFATSIEPNIFSDDIAQLKAFPNPNDGNATIEFKLPQGINSGEIVLYSMSGTEIKRYPVDGTFGNLVLNNRGLSSGTYMYQLIAGNVAVDAKKMIIIR